jgi:hypothetical protein
VPQFAKLVALMLHADAADGVLLLTAEAPERKRAFSELADVGILHNVARSLATNDESFCGRHTSRRGRTRRDWTNTDLVVEDGKLMVSGDLSEEELDDLGLAGEITVEFLEAHKFYLKHHQVRFRGRRAPPRQRLNRRRTRGASTRATCSRRRRHPVRASSLLTIETCEISAPSARGYLSADEATVNMAKRRPETAQMTLSRLFAASF